MLKSVQIGKIILMDQTARRGHQLTREYSIDLPALVASRMM